MPRFNFLHSEITGHGLKTPAQLYDMRTTYVKNLKKTPGRTAEKLLRQKINEIEQIMVERADVPETVIQAHRHATIQTYRQGLYDFASVN
jgi:cobalamin biosynthesis protein CbiD